MQNDVKGVKLEKRQLVNDNQKFRRIWKTYPPKIGSSSLRFREKVYEHLILSISKKNDMKLKHNFHDGRLQAT